MASFQGELMDRVRATAPHAWPTSLVEDAIEGLKFRECLTDEMAIEMVRLRMFDRVGVLRVLAEPLAYAT
jgi:hypothetical protein